MSATSDLYEQLRTAAAGVQLQANTADTYAQTQERIQNVLMQKQAMETQKLAQQAFAQSNNLGPAAAQPGAAPADSEDPIVSGYNDVNQQTTKARQEAKVYRGLGMSGEADKADQRANVLSNQAREYAGKIVEQQRDQANMAVQQLAGVTDQDSFEKALIPVLRGMKNNPKMGEVAGVLNGINFTPDGRPLYDDKAKAAVQSLSKRAETVYQQKELEAKALTLQREQAKDVADAQWRRDEALRKDQEAAANRAARGDAQGERVTQRAETQAQSISSAYKADKQVQNFADMAAPYKASQKYLFTGQVDAKGDPVRQPSQGQDASGDLALLDGYLKIVHPNYKGSVYELKQIDKMAGVPVRMWTGIKNLLYGDELPVPVRYEMFNTMTRTFKEYNDAQIEREDSALKKVRTLDLPRGTDNSQYVPQYALRPDRKSTAAPTVAEGATATNPKTGEKITFKDGKWQPLTQ